MRPRPTRPIRRTPVTSMRRPFRSSVGVGAGGVIGIGVAAAAIMGTQDITAWVIGLVVSVLSVVLAAILWSSRTL